MQTFHHKLVALVVSLGCLTTSATPLGKRQGFFDFFGGDDNGGGFGGSGGLFDNNNNQNINQDVQDNQNALADQAIAGLSKRQGFFDFFGGNEGGGGGGGFGEFSENDNQNINQAVNANQNLLADLAVEEFFGNKGRSSSYIPVVGAVGAAAAPAAFYQDDSIYAVDQSPTFYDKGFFKRSSSDESGLAANQNMNLDSDVNTQLDLDNMAGMGGVGTTFPLMPTLRFGLSKRGLGLDSLAEGLVGGNDCGGPSCGNKNKNVNSNVNINKNINTVSPLPPPQLLLLHFF